MLIIDGLRDVSSYAPTMEPVVPPTGGGDDGGGEEGGDDETDKDEGEANIQDFGLFSIQV